MKPRASMLLGAACPLFASLGALFSAPAQAAPTPNIVFVLFDDMGYGQPRSYNAKSALHTPHLDRLAAEGMRFTDAHSAAAVCTPTRYGVLTGRYPARIAGARASYVRVRQSDKTEVSMPHLVSPLRDVTYEAAIRELELVHSFLVRRAGEEIATSAIPAEHWGIGAKRLNVDLIREGRPKHVGKPTERFGEIVNMAATIERMLALLRCGRMPRGLFQS